VLANIALFAQTASQIINQNAGKACGSGGCGSSLQKLIGDISTALLWVISTAAVLFIIYGGIQMVISQGDPAKIKTARNTILYAVIGLVVGIASYAVVSFVVSNIK
jgi:hypothetical protein